MQGYICRSKTGTPRISSLVRIYCRLQLRRAFSKGRIKIKNQESKPLHRPRRLRRTEALRSLVRETRLAPEDFILPLFACSGKEVRREVASMPGVYNLSIDEIAREALQAFEMGVRGVILFGIPDAKDE